MEFNMAHYAHITNGVVDNVIVIDAETLALGHWGNPSEWVQTSYNNNFRKQFASINGYYDDAKNKFILNQPYPSWTLDSNDDWQAPVIRPNIFNKPGSEEFILLPMKWDELNQKWFSDDNKYVWNQLDNLWDLV